MTPEERAIANAHRSALEAVIAERERQLAEEAEAARQRETKEQALRRQAARDLYHEHLAKERLRIEKLSDAELKREAERVFAEPSPPQLKFARTWTPPPEPVMPQEEASQTPEPPPTHREIMMQRFHELLDAGQPPQRALQTAFTDAAAGDYELVDDLPDSPAKPPIMGRELKRRLGLDQ